MKSCGFRPILIFLFFFAMMNFGCNNADSTKNEKLQKNISPLIGVWEKTAGREKQASDAEVKITISESTLTMDAPGCVIIGTYTAGDGLLKFTITSAKGQRCAAGQTIGKTESVQYTVTDSQLILIPPMAGAENRLVYQRVDDLPRR